MEDPNDQNDQREPLLVKNELEKKARLKARAKAAAKAALGQTRIEVIDGIASINSLFTVGVFLGLTFSPAQHSVETNPHCEVSITTTKRLVLFEVISFSCFVFSSIIALGIKMEINILNRNNDAEVIPWPHALGFGMLCAGIFSMLGCGFLIVSFVHVIEIRLGVFSCGGEYTLIAFLMVVMIVAAFGAFIFFTWSMLKRRKFQPSNHQE